MTHYKLTALELVLTFLTMFGPVTKESLTAVCVLFEAVLGYNEKTGKFDKDAVKKARGVAYQLCILAENYGVMCEPERLETVGGRRAILSIILGPIVEHLASHDLEEMRNSAVEAMMIVTFKPLDEVQAMVNAWAQQAIREGTYQTRVSAWTGRSMEPFDQVDTNDAVLNSTTHTSDDISIVANSNALEVVLTLLAMLGPVTKESVAATKVLFEAVIGFDEAKAKFDKQTVSKVLTVAEPLCWLSSQYGVVAEPRMLHTLPGARAILRVVVGPIIEGHSPAELKDMRNDAGEAMAMLSRRPLDEIQELVAAWIGLDSRHRARVAAWTGKDMGFFDQAGTARDSTTAKAIQNYESGPSRDLSPTNLDVATATNMTGLVTVQALFAIGLLPETRCSFKTLFPTPLDVCFGRKACIFKNDCVGGVEAIKSPTEYGSDSDNTEVTNYLMGASDEEDCHRLDKFQFPTNALFSPALRSSTETTPEMSPLLNMEEDNTFVNWMATWETKEMSGWKAVLQKTTKAEVELEKRKAMFGGYEEAWEIAQLSAWSAALKRDSAEDGCLLGLYASDAALYGEVEGACGETQESKLTDDDAGVGFIKLLSQFFGFA
ncbi:hypothetical protein B0J17DRAFT_662267 [Rhizoctonia solani]|nr:hypothetical protein B0J17DRAFT_662267 [Rhizoctonia solani]